MRVATVAEYYTRDAIPRDTGLFATYYGPRHADSSDPDQRVLFVGTALDCERLASAINHNV